MVTLANSRLIRYFLVVLPLQLLPQPDAVDGDALLHPGVVVRRLPSGLRLHAGGLPDRPSVRRRRDVLGDGASRRDADAQHRSSPDEVVVVERRRRLRRRRASLRRRLPPTSGRDERQGAERQTWRHAIKMITT